MTLLERPRKRRHNQIKETEAKMNPTTKNKESIETRVNQKNSALITIEKLKEKET